MVRRNFMTLAMAALLFVGIGCGGAGKSFSLVAEEGTEVRIYEVFGMNCPGCHGGVVKLINKLPGVIDSQANWKKQKLAIKIHQDIELSDDEIFSAIKKANFTPGKRLE